MADKRRKPAEPLAGPKLLERFARAGLDRAGWYDTAAAEIAAVCDAEGWDRVTFTNTLALLSPRVSVRRNIRLSLQYFGTGRYLANTLGNVKRSVAIYERTGKVGGPKVSAFAAALLGDHSAIVLDTWMAKALLICELDPQLPKLRRKATRELAFRRIRTVAKRLGVSPRDCQACIWTGIIREFGGIPAPLCVLEEYNRWLSYNREFPASGPITTPGED